MKEMPAQSSVPSAVRTLAARFYTDPAQFQREREAIFFRTWQYAGHASQVTRPGDFFTFSIGDQALFCIRDENGTLRCFYNVCAHRGHALVSDDGHCSMLTCPYHAWTYELDGRLRRAPNQAKVPGFDGSGVRLTEVRVEVFCGFVFVNLDPHAAPMGEWYPEVEEQLRAFVPDLERLQPVHWVRIEEACNWKVTVENYSECYHCRLNHPTFARGVIDPNSYDIRPQGHCLRHTTRAADLSRMSYSIDPALPHGSDYSSWFLWPAFSFQVYPGALLNTYHWRPLHVENTVVFRGWYSIDGEESEEVARMADQDRRTTVEEDIRLVESVQRGMHSRGWQAGPLIIDPDFGLNSEHSIAALHGWLHEALAAQPSAPTA